MFLSSITTDKTKKFHNSKFLYSLNKIVFLVVGGFFFGLFFAFETFYTCPIPLAGQLPYYYLELGNNRGIN